MKPQTLLIVFALILLCAGVYWPVYHFPFVNFDDPGCVYQNPHVVSGLTADNIQWAFTAFWVGHWAPLVWISYQADATFFHLNPGIMHVENAALHVISVILLFEFMNLGTGRRWCSAMVAAVFAVHPLHVESVAWITERRDMLSGPPLLGALIAYVQFARSSQRGMAVKWYFISLMLFTLSLMGKATAVTLPALLFLVDLWPLERIRIQSTFKLQAKKGLRWSKLVLEKLPFAIISIAVSVAAIQAQRAVGAAVSMAAQPLSARMGNAAVSYVLYVAKFVVPMHLAVFYPLREWSILQVSGAIAVLVSLTAMVLWLRRGYAVFGWFWFLIVLLPVIGFFQSGPQAMADRYMFFPTIGLTTALVWGLAELKPSRWLISTAVAAILLLTIGARHQLGYWRDTRTLFERAISIINNGPDVNIQLAHLYLQEGDRAGAEREYTTAARLDPGNYVPEYDLGNLLIDQPDRAIPHFMRALQLRPHSAQIENNLAIAWIRSGRPDLAFTLFQSAIIDDPNNADAHANLGMLLLQSGQKRDAANEFAAAIRVDPDNRTARSGMDALAKPGN